MPHALLCIGRLEGVDHVRQPQHPAVTKGSCASAEAQATSRSRVGRGAPGEYTMSVRSKPYFFRPPTTTSTFCLMPHPAGAARDTGSPTPFSSTSPAPLMRRREEA